MFLQARTHLEHFCSPSDLHEEAVLLSFITFHTSVSLYSMKRNKICRIRKCIRMPLVSYRERSFSTHSEQLFEDQVHLMLPTGYLDVSWKWYGILWNTLGYHINTKVCEYCNHILKYHGIILQNGDKLLWNILIIKWLTKSS